jgi:hypothetical protein
VAGAWVVFWNASLLALRSALQITPQVMLRVSIQCTPHFPLRFGFASLAPLPF